ncbi:NAD(P)H-hydrate epimerase [Planctomicrobium sp. SH661]|uniref:NAD(P)H-hydrate epimerase n=1 Tax=Planctomicrobium sp. SH661 TaxID=3448124 RepID=UPI003F5C7AD2
MSHELVLSREQVRAVDRIAIEEFGIPGMLLMENAGRGCADLLIDQGVCTSSPVVICCGKGNNGGDGFVMARHLEIRGVPVEILIFCSPKEFSGDAALNYRIASRTDIPIHQLNLPDDEEQLVKHLDHASWIVDALLGTGTSGGIRPPLDLVVEKINAAGKPVFAIDIPSGLDCDLGDPVSCCVNATVTATMVATKPGFRSKTGVARTGAVHVVEIGIPQTALAMILGQQ